MKHKGFLMLLVLLGAVLCSLPALAGSVSMNRTYRPDADLYGYRNWRRHGIFLCLLPARV